MRSLMFSRIVSIITPRCGDRKCEDIAEERTVDSKGR
jgi:hypothetical protein